MSHDKRKLLGSRISSIFTSNGSHHHRNSSSQQKLSSTVKISTTGVDPQISGPPFRPQPSFTNVNETPEPQSPDASQLLTNAHSTRESHDLSHGARQSSHLQTPQISRGSPFQESFDILLNSSIRALRQRSTRKPPSDGEHYQLTSKSSNLLTTVKKSPIFSHFTTATGSTKKEIRNLSVDPRSGLDVITILNPNLASIPTSKQLSPLNITCTPEDRGRINSSPTVSEQQVSLESSAQSTAKLAGHVMDKIVSPSLESFSKSLSGQSLVRKSCEAQEGNNPRVSIEELSEYGDFSSHLQFDIVESPNNKTVSDSKGYQQGATPHSASSEFLPRRTLIDRTLAKEILKHLFPGTSLDEQIRRSDRGDPFTLDIFPKYGQEKDKRHILQKEAAPLQKRGEYIPSCEGISHDISVKSYFDESTDRASHSNKGRPNPSGEFATTPEPQCLYEPGSSLAVDPGLLGKWDIICEPAEQGFELLDGPCRQQSQDGSLMPSAAEICAWGTQALMPQTPHQRAHTRMLSMSSVYSAGSCRHISLATLRMALNLRPGEGERSSYVDTIRKSAGTSFNEADPGKWKLPTGILPVDKRDFMQQSSKNFRKGVSSMGYRTKKSSGVELKHGHLQPRLLAAEVDEGDSTNKFGTLGRSSTLQNKSLTPVTSKSSSLSGGFNGMSRANSLERANTLASISTAGDLQSSGSEVSSSRRGSSVSFPESDGSINNERDVDIYYQHQSFKLENEVNCFDNDGYSNRGTEILARDSDDSEEEMPQLILANPDSN